jgi:putative phage-type endonuclease
MAGLGWIHPKVKPLLEATYFEQRSQEWLDLRENMLTASDAATACGDNPYETPGELLIKKVAKKKWGGNEATARGTILEPVARDFYDQTYGRRSHEIGLVQHPVHKWLGGSADGVTEDGLLIEIKCPLTRKIESKVPKHYVAQIQLLLEILDFEECDFIQYRDEPFEFMVVRVLRDRDWFTQKLPVMQAFWEKVKSTKLEDLCEVELDDTPSVSWIPICEIE